MKIFTKLLACTAAVLLMAACGDELTPDTPATGEISGKIVYSNLEENQHAGITVCLEKTDGLRTMQVISSVKNGSVSSARSLAGNTVTSSDGTYSFKKLEPGTYTVYAASNCSQERAVYTNVVVREAETTVADVLMLTATGGISGTITKDNAKTGNTGFLVFVAGTNYMALTNDEGSYTINGIPAGSGYHVVAEKNNVCHNLSSSITVTAGELTALENNNFTSEELDTNGKNGSCMVWLGAFDSADEIKDPEPLNAYFNKTDGCSYIYDGNEWSLLAKSGTNGTDGKDGTNSGALAIGTVLSTEEPVNQDVTITVNVSKTDIVKIGYVYSKERKNWINARDVLKNSDFVELNKSDGEKYIITAAENGYYTIAAKDSEGYAVFEEEYVSNIDRNCCVTFEYIDVETNHICDKEFQNLVKGDYIKKPAKRLPDLGTGIQGALVYDNIWYTLDGEIFNFDIPIESDLTLINYGGHVINYFNRGCAEIFNNESYLSLRVDSFYSREDIAEIIPELLFISLKNNKITTIEAVYYSGEPGSSYYSYKLKNPISDIENYVIYDKHEFVYFPTGLDWVGRNLASNEDYWLNYLSKLN